MGEFIRTPKNMVMRVRRMQTFLSQHPNDGGNFIELVLTTDSGELMFGLEPNEAIILGDALASSGRKHDV